MSGETEQQVSGWTTDTLKSLFEVRSIEVDGRIALLRQLLENKIDNLNNLFQITKSLSDKAIDKAEGATDQRLALLNESRQTNEDNSRKFLPKAEYQQAHDALVMQVQSIQRSVYVATGAVIVIGALISFVLQVLLHGIK
jgi:ElaB/YqjD/DUF883 family membrane-anchored ribosome-binding protein